MDTNMKFDKKLRDKIKSDPKSYMRNLYSSMPDNFEFIVKENTANTIYFVLPEESSLYLEGVNAAGLWGLQAGTAGSISTVTTASSATSTLATLGSAGTLGTIDVISKF